MHTRPATPEDFSAIADISLHCFWKDELYDFTNAFKTQYPDHFRDSFLRRYKYNYNTPGFAIHVAVTDEDDPEYVQGARVVAYAVWYRYGTSEQAQEWHTDTPSKVLERTLLSLKNSYISLFHLDKSLDPVRRKRWLASSQESFPAIHELWKLQNLCVHPDFQRRGIAGLLIDWGKERAVEEDCPVGLSSSAKGAGVYLRAGFRRYGTLRVEDFPVDDVPLLLWEPPGLEGRFGMRGNALISTDSA